jgi:hypothetical protein
MRLRKGMLIGAWILVALNLGLAFAAIGLLARMTPAIATILAESDYSLEACDSMLAGLAIRSGEPGDPGSARFLAGLERAEANITEPEEGPIIDRLRQLSGRVLAGDPESVAPAVETIMELAGVNRRAMVDADERAQRLGTAGAWGVALMAILSFAAGLAFIRFMSDRVLSPLEELRGVLAPGGPADPYRRCTSATAPSDLRAIFSGVNQLLDQVAEREGVDPED